MSRVSDMSINQGPSVPVSRPPYTSTDVATIIAGLLVALVNCVVLFDPSVMPLDEGTRQVAIQMLSGLLATIIVGGLGHRAVKHAVHVMALRSANQALRSRESDLPQRH